MIGNLCAYKANRATAPATTRPAAFQLTWSALPANCDALGEGAEVIAFVAAGAALVAGAAYVVEPMTVVPGTLL